MATSFTDLNKEWTGFVTEFKRAYGRNPNAASAIDMIDSIDSIFDVLNKKVKAVKPLIAKLTNEYDSVITETVKLDKEIGEFRALAASKVDGKVVDPLNDIKAGSLSTDIAKYREIFKGNRNSINKDKRQLS
jgi:hypothetical protein